MKKIVAGLFIFVSFCFAQQGDSISPIVYWKSYDGKVINDTETDLMWQFQTDTTEVALMSWQESVIYCHDLDFAGFDDWRVPNVFELYSTCDSNKTKPSTQILTNITENRWSFWTSTSTAYNPEINAWYIDFSDALVRYSSKNGVHNVICVRDIDMDKNRSVNAGEDQTIRPGTNVILTATVEDNSDIVCLLWKEGDQVLSEDLSFSKSDFALGEHNITLTVCYNNDRNATDDVTITVQNHAPIAKDINITRKYGNGTGFDITLLGSDEDGDSLTYEILTQPVDGSLDPLDGDVVTYYPVPSPNIPSTFTYKVNDGITDSNIATVTITISPNHAPIAQDQTINMLEDDPSINIQLQATDVDGDSLTYTLVQGSSGKVGDTIYLANTPTDGVLGFSLNQDKSGTEIIKFKANDGSIDSNIATITIHVAPVDDLLVNDPPNVSLGLDRQIQEGENITLTADADDIDGRVVLYIWKIDDIVVQNNNTPTLVLENLSVGKHKVFLQVTDNEVLSSVDTIFVTVVP